MVLHENTQNLRRVVTDIKDTIQALDFATERLRQERLAIEAIQPLGEWPDRPS